MIKIAHLVKPCHHDWRAFKAAQAGKSSLSEVVIFASAIMNINQNEKHDDLKIIKCYPKFNYLSPNRDGMVVRKKNLFGDLLAMIIIVIEFILSKISGGRLNWSKRVLTLNWISRHIRFAYLKEVLNFKPDIIHAHDLETLRAASYFKKLIGCKVIYDAHEFEIDRNPPMGKLSKLYVSHQEREYIKSVDLVVTVSNEIACELQTNYSLKEKPIVIFNIPPKVQFKSFDIEDLKFFSPNQSLQSLQRYDYIGVYTGLLTINRGIETVLEALTVLPDHALMLVGPRNNEIYFKELLLKIKQMNLEERVFIIDNIDSGLISFISRADYGLVTTLPICKSSDYSMPNKLFEYINANLPILCSDTLSASKFVKEYNLGEVFESSNSLDLVKKINAIVSTDRSKYIASDRLLDEISIENQFNELKNYMFSKV